MVVIYCNNLLFYINTNTKPKIIAFKRNYKNKTTHSVLIITKMNTYVGNKMKKTLSIFIYVEIVI